MKRFYIAPEDYRPQEFRTPGCLTKIVSLVPASRRFVNDSQLGMTINHSKPGITLEYWTDAVWHESIETLLEETKTILDYIKRIPLLGTVTPVVELALELVYDNLHDAPQPHLHHAWTSKVWKIREPYFQCTRPTMERISYEEYQRMVSNKDYAAQ